MEEEKSFLVLFNGLYSTQKEYNQRKDLGPEDLFRNRYRDNTYSLDRQDSIDLIEKLDVFMQINMKEEIIKTNLKNFIKDYEGTLYKKKKSIREFEKESNLFYFQYRLDILKNEKSISKDKYVKS